MVTNTKESNDAIASQASGRRAVAITANIFIILISLIFSLLIAEAGFRIATGVSLLDGSNWRALGVRTKRIGDRALYDPVLGWTLKDDYRSEGFNTIGLGVRRNFAETDVRGGSILAVGDSFTEGFEEVNDAGTWPAHLEKMLGQPVVNGGVAGYATDQIILRAEQLLPVIAPKTLIIGFTNVDFERAAMSEAGAPKPYFSIENNDLVYHAPAPLDPKVEESAVGSALRGVLGYSALSDYILSRLAPRFWYPREASVYKSAATDPFQVTCRLLEHLKHKTDEKNTRLLLFLQYSGELILEEPGITWDMQRVTQCARAANIQVVDQFASLKALTQGKSDLVDDYYTDQGDEYGHMTSKGNEQAAKVLAEALKSEPAAETAVPASPSENKEVLRN